MNTKKLLIILALITALCITAIIIIPDYSGNDFDEGAYSPVSVNPPPEDLSQTEEISKPESLDSYKLAVDVILNNVSNIETAFASKVNAEYIEKIKNNLGSDYVEKLANTVETQKRLIHLSKTISTAPPFWKIPKTA